MKNLYYKLCHYSQAHLLLLFKSLLYLFSCSILTKLLERESSFTKKVYYKICLEFISNVNQRATKYSSGFITSVFLHTKPAALGRRQINSLNCELLKGRAVHFILIFLVLSGFHFTFQEISKHLLKE